MYAIRSYYEISVESEVGRGSVFRFHLPAMPCVDPGVSEASEATDPKVNFQKLMNTGLGKGFPIRILVAEDNLTNQKVVKLILKRLGYQATFVITSYSIHYTKLYDVRIECAGSESLYGFIVRNHANRNRIHFPFPRDLGDQDTPLCRNTLGGERCSKRQQHKDGSFESVMGLFQHHD